MNERVRNVLALRDSAAVPDTQLDHPVPDFSNDLARDEEKVHLRDYWRSVRKRLWLVVGLTVLVTTFVTIIMLRRADTYEAKARVRVDLENNNNPALSAFKDSPVVVNNPTNDPAYFNTQLQILAGPGLLRRAAKTLDLERNPDFLGSQQQRSVWQNLERILGLGSRDQSDAVKNQPEEIPLVNSAATVASREDLVEAKRLAPYVKALQHDLKIDPVKEKRLPVKETRLIDVRFTHTDPQVAARIVNAIADNFVLSNLEVKTETNATSGDYLQKRIAELQSQIRNGEERLINYAKSNQILTLDANQNTVVERLVGLNKQLLEAENERKMSEAAYRAAQAPGAASALAEENSKHISDADQKLTDLRQRRAQLLVDNTEKAPEVEEINEQIGVLEQQVRDMRNRATSVVTTNLETRYRQGLQREQALRTAFDQQRGETLTQNEAAINYRIIQQEIETNKSLLNGLLQRSKENDVVLAGTPNNIRVVDYAISPDEPVGPHRLLNVAVAFVLALAFAIGFAIFLEYIDNTVRSISDVETMLHLPALAVIPSVGRRAPRLLSAVGIQQTQQHSGTRPELLINADVRSPIAEAYKQLRTSVLLSTAGRAPKSLLVTSAQPGEGKSTTAVNTAISLAQTGAKVLILDADMRRPTVHTIFRLTNVAGLSTVLSREMGEPEIHALINLHEESGLHILTSGAIPPNPAELLGSEQMRRLLQVLEPHFTHIVIDSPPIASVTDGVLIASMVDGVLLVVHGGRSSRDLVRRTKQLLHGVGAKIFGVVLNNIDLRTHDYYYQPGYYNVAKTDQIHSTGKTDQIASSAR